MGTLFNPIQARSKGSSREKQQKEMWTSVGVLGSRVPTHTQLFSAYFLTELELEFTLECVTLSVYAFPGACNGIV